MIGVAGEDLAAVVPGEAGGEVGDAVPSRTASLGVLLAARPDVPALLALT